MKTSEAIEQLRQNAQAEYDPPAAERVYYTRNKDGQRGWMVRRSGELSIRLDRPRQDIWVKYAPHEWTEILEERPLTKMQCALVAFEADKALCKVLNLPKLAKRDWLLLTNERRISFMEHGPDKLEIRRLLWQDVMSRLEALT